MPKHYTLTRTTNPTMLRCMLMFGRHPCTQHPHGSYVDPWQESFKTISGLTSSNETHSPSPSSPETKHDNNISYTLNPKATGLTQKWLLGTCLQRGGENNFESSGKRPVYSLSLEVCVLDGSNCMLLVGWISQESKLRQAAFQGLNAICWYACNICEHTCNYNIQTSKIHMYACLMPTKRSHMTPQTPAKLA